MNYKLSAEDVRTIFTNCLLLYKGQLVYSHRSEGLDVTIEHLKDNKLAVVKFKFEDFEPVQARLGYVNFTLGCAYISRKPIRRYSIGLNMENVKVHYVTDQRVSMQIQNQAMSFRDRAYLDMFTGTYPSLAEAYAAARDFKTAYAFDRQFAIDRTGNVFYRNGQIVGKFSEESGNIAFFEGYTYLNSLLDGSYGKSA